MRTVVSIVCGLLMVLACSAAFAENDPWSGRRAQTLPDGRWEVGVFSPLRYGLTRDVELSTHPLAFFVMPNLRAKIGHHGDETWTVASRYGIHYPTQLLRLFSREGTGGVLPETATIPQIIAFRADIVATLQAPYARRWLTASLGFTAAPRFGPSDFATIDFPVVFPRTAPYHTTATGHAGFTVEGVVVDPIHFVVEARGFWMPGLDGAFAAETTAMLSWKPGLRFMLEGGLMTTYGAYPYGLDRRFFPLLDAKFAF